MVRNYTRPSYSAKAEYPLQDKNSLVMDSRLRGNDDIGKNLSTKWIIAETIWPISAAQESALD